MSIYSNNFWKYAKNYGKEATLDEVFVKWANKIDLDIDLGSEIFKEVTAEINKLFGIKEAVDSQFLVPQVGSNSDMNPAGSAQSVISPDANAQVITQDPATSQTNIPIKKEEQVKPEVKPEETLLGSMLQGEQSNTVPPTNNSGIQ